MVYTRTVEFSRRCISEASEVGGELAKLGHWISQHFRASGRAINLLNTKRNLLYLRNQSVPRSKHSPPQL